MTPLPKSTFGMKVKVIVLLQLFNKSKLRNGTKTFLEPKFLCTVKFKKLGFIAPLILACNQWTRPASRHQFVYQSIVSDSANVLFKA